MKERILNFGLIALLIWIVGCLPLTGMWICCEKPLAEGVMGYFDYRTVAYGDYFLLPIVVASMYSLINQRIQRKYIRSALFAGVISSVIAVFIQLSWLRPSEEPIIPPNWTFTEHGYFNLAGLYHAFFFVVMFFVSGSMLTIIWLYEEEKTKTRYILESLLMWGAGGCFLLLHLTDTYSELYPMAGIVLTTLGIVAVCIFVFYFSRHLYKKHKCLTKNVRKDNNTGDV